MFISVDTFTFPRKLRKNSHRQPCHRNMINTVQLVVKWELNAQLFREINKCLTWAVYVSIHIL